MAKIFLSLVFLVLFVSCSHRQTSWMALGDSITYLNDHPEETGNRITKGYMTRATEELPYLTFMNKGFNGWTAGDVAKEIDNLGLASADLYTVFLGTNDWWRGRPLGTMEDYKSNAGYGTFFGSYRIIIERLKSLNPEARIILITPMQRVDFVYIADMKNNAYGSYREKNGQSLAQFAEAVNAIGGFENLKVVDLYNESRLGLENLVRFKRLKDPVTGVYKNYSYPDFIDVPFDPLTDEYPYPEESIDMTYDGLHPSDKGYAVIASMLINAID